MKNRKSVLCALGFVLVFTIAATAADAPQLTFKFHKINVPGAIQTLPAGINNAGISVGQYEDSSNVLHGYMLKGKMLTTLDDPNGTNTSVNGIQYKGTTVVGSYTNSSNFPVGFMYNGTFTDISPPGATASAAYGINDEGVIVGSYTDSSGVVHGFRYENMMYTTLDVPDASATVATGVNNKGHMSFYWQDSSGAGKGYVCGGKGCRTITVPGATSTYSMGLNNADDVSNMWFDSMNASHGALWQDGHFHKFNCHPHDAAMYAGGLNDHHAIAGTYEDLSGGPFSGFKETY